MFRFRKVFYRGHSCIADCQEDIWMLYLQVLMGICCFLHQQFVFKLFFLQNPPEDRTQHPEVLHRVRLNLISVKVSLLMDAVNDSNGTSFSYSWDTKRLNGVIAVNPLLIN